MSCLPCRLLPALLLLAALSVPAAAEDAWRDDGNSATPWQLQPGWQPNPSPGATVRSEGGALVFTVPEADKGMKLSRPVRPFPLSFYRYLVLRYRAENLRTDLKSYFVYVNDGGPGECSPLRLEDLQPDGAWHTVAVDASKLAAGQAITALALQVVPAGPGGGRLFVDSISFADAPPADAEVLRQEAPPAAAPARPDWVMPLTAEGWHANPDWLGNPGTDPQVAAGHAGLVFRVAGAQRGMKWSRSLGEAVSLREYRYLSLRYRGEGLSRVGDYAVCVIGTAGSSGMDYEPALSPNALEADGQWHTLSVELGPTASKIPTMRQIAIQVQGGTGSAAALTIRDLRFTNTLLRLPLADCVSFRPGWPEKLGAFVPLDLGSLRASPAETLRAQLGIEGWFAAERITAQGVPFRLRAAGKEVCRTGMLAHDALIVPVGRRTSEVYLLLASLLTGQEEDVRGGGPFTAIEDVDRLRVRLEYATGPAGECLPLDAATKQRRVASGPRVLCAFADPGRALQRVVIQDRAGNAAFALLAATANTGRGILEAYRVRPTPPPVTPSPGSARAGAPTLDIRPGTLMFANGALEAVFETSAGLRLAHLRQRGGMGEVLPTGGGPLLEVVVGGKAVPADALAVEDARLPDGASDAPEVGGRGKTLAVTLAGRGPAAGLKVTLRLSLAQKPELAVEGEVENTGATPLAVALRGPGVSGVRVGASAADNYYLFPQSGAVWNNVATTLEQPYCGLFPVQFMDVYNRRTGGGVSLRTEDQEGTARSYTLRRGDDGLTALGVSYPERTLEPGAKRPLVRTAIGVHGGDWHAALAAYQEWLRAWYRPAAARKPWFREVFNFRQRFLWGLDPLYEQAAGKLDLQRALDEGQAEFGGVDYLHLFDWGNCGQYGRIYGRTGDYSPWDYLKGGLDGFRSAVAGAQEQGTPVGLYIEGYLLEERGRLGQAHGKEWQRIAPGGSPAYWPQSTEMFVCPWVPAWREVQADTYARTVRDTGVSGMYMDEFGFCSPGWADCYSPAHGHPVPGSSVIGERGMTQMVRARVDGAKPGVALYSEESPPDVNSRYQDGSFTYAMSRSRTAPTRVPLNVLRFAIPGFKTFEILICDKPTGSWATGVQWVFFNGEGIWLEGPAEEWFEPQTLEAIRKCHAILRAHRGAFTSDQVEALAPTLVDGVFANVFAAPGERVYTLYNGHPETVAADVLRVPHRPGARYEDAWNGQELKPRISGGFATLRLTLGPQEAGCVVVRGR